MFLKEATYVMTTGFTVIRCGVIRLLTATCSRQNNPALDPVPRSEHVELIPFKKHHNTRGWFGAMQTF